MRSKPVLEFPAAEQVGVIEDDQVAEISAQIAEISSDVPLPDIIAGRLGDDQDHPLALVNHQPLNQHQADKGLAESDAVAKKGPAVLGGDLQQGVVPFLLILVEDGVHTGLALFPFPGGHLVTAEEFLQGLGIDLEWGIFPDVALDGSENFRRNVFGLVPVLFIPFLKDVNRATGDLNVQFDIFSEARKGEIGGSDQRRGADNFQPGVGDVGFGVEFFLAIDAAFDLAGFGWLNDGRNAGKEIILFLFSFQAVIKLVGDPAYPFQKGLLVRWKPHRP